MVHGKNRSTEGNSPSCYPRGRPLLLLTVAELPVPEHFLAGGTPELCEITAHRCGATGRAMRGIPQSPSLSAWRRCVDSSSGSGPHGAGPVHWWEETELGWAADSQGGAGCSRKMQGSPRDVWSLTVCAHRLDHSLRVRTAWRRPTSMAGGLAGTGLGHGRCDHRAFSRDAQRPRLGELRLP